ncbi:MAG: cyclase/dehydrase [Candidatus Solibacter sp.]|nr:cyclase/dehydrase [Candidatus Solibacter sp.]
MKSVVIDAPVGEVFRFHERPDALALLSTAFPPMRKTGGTGDGIRTGTRVDLRIGGVKWIALHTAYEKDRLFVDEQIEGPFARWVHRHEFEAVGERTRLTDRVEYELPGGGVVNALFGWPVRLGLRNMFAHRHRVTRDMCEKRQGGEGSRS